MNKMSNYERETKKYAIWDDTITKGFINWLKGEKIYDKNKKRISFYLDEEIHNSWIQFMKERGFTTLSKLIRSAVNDCIEHHHESSNFEKITNISHDLKQPLTTIKGFSQLLLEKPYKDKLDEKTTTIIQNILEQSLSLENKIKTVLDNDESSENIIDILLIEDDQATIRLITTYFESQDLVCKGVLSGKKALEIISNTTPKLILLDIILQDLSGVDLCKKVKSDESTRHIPVYFLSGLPETEVKSKSELAGADGFILKPFNLSDLRKLLDYLK